MRTLVFGPRGFMGSRLLAGLQAAASHVDITDRSAVRAELESFRPEAVINAAGRAGDTTIDWCEDHVRETMLSNVHGPIVLSQECLDRNIHLTHLSSGCVYYGNTVDGKGYAETDRPNFLENIYARTKFYAEEALRHLPVLILRLRLPFDGTLHPRNLLVKLRGYSLLLDAQNSMTYVPDFIEAARFLIEKKRIGIYHVVNEGTVSPYQVIEMSGAKNLIRISAEDLNRRVRARRSNCTLSIEKLKNESCLMRPVAEAVRTAWRKLTIVKGGK